MMRPVVWDKMLDKGEERANVLSPVFYLRMFILFVFAFADILLMMTCNNRFSFLAWCV